MQIQLKGNKMPNWCSNHVIISHEDKEKIDAIQTEVEKQEPQLFQMLRPRPPEEEEQWYSWNIENWGTKWEASFGDFQRISDNTITINYDTAWGPSTALWEYMFNELNYDIKAFYLEEGVAFAGKFEDGFNIFCDYGNGEDIDPEVDEFWGITERQEEEERNNAYDDWVSDCHALEKTEWFKGKIKPKYEGVYETQSKAWPYPSKSYWDGNKWCFYDWFEDEHYGELVNKVTQWRGITEDDYMKTSLRDLQQTLDNMLDPTDE